MDPFVPLQFFRPENWLGGNGEQAGKFESNGELYCLPEHMQHAEEEVLCFRTTALMINVLLEMINSGKSNCSK